MNNASNGEYSSTEQQLRTIAEPLPDVHPSPRVDWIHDSER